MLALSKWDLDIETNDGEEYTSLVRAVRRTHQRFKLLFVSCSPSQGEKVRHDLMDDVPAKKYELLDIKESIDNLYEAINNIPNLLELDVLFIRGLEYSIFEYEDREFGDISQRSQSKVYGGSWAGVPPVLARLNMQRELFRDRFSHICFVFLLPHFAIDYFIRRAPDFYDWKSGIYRFKTDAVDLQSESNTIWDIDDYEEYSNLNTEEKLAKITATRACLDEETDPETRWKLLFQLAVFYQYCGRSQAALDTFDLTLQINPDIAGMWAICGDILSGSGRYEDAIIRYEHAIQIDPEKDEAWYDRGYALAELGRYEEAIASYDCSLELKPDNDTVWYSRGIALRNLDRHEEVITSYDRAVELKPDKHEAWWGRGIALDELGRYEEAIASYDRSLELKPDNDAVWYNRGYALDELGRYEEAIAGYDRAVDIKPDKHEAWYNRGIALVNLGRYQEAIASYDRAVEIKPDKHEAWWGRGIALGNLGRSEEAIASFDRSLEIKPDDDAAQKNRKIALNCLVENLYSQGLASFKQENYADALLLWQQVFKNVRQEQLGNASDLIQSFLDELLLPQFQQPAVRDILPQILPIYAAAGVLPELGVALTRNLKAIQSPIISNYTATEWLKMWQELGKPHPELALALRMVTAGIKYKQNPTDDRVFLSLPQEMRPLLREALGLEP